MSWFESFAGAAFGGGAVASALGYITKQYFEHRLKADLEVVKARLTEIADINKAKRAEEANVRVVVKKYSRVVLLAASDLQDRLWHLCRNLGPVRTVLLGEDQSSPESAVWPMTGQHYLISTLYCFARYLAWIEILKQNISLLEFNEDDNTRAFNHYTKRVERMLADTGPQDCCEKDSVLIDEPVFQFMQVEIGESLQIGGGEDNHCMSFQAFRENYATLVAKNEGLAQLRKLLISAATGGEGNFCQLRILLVHNALIDLLTFLHEYNGVDPEHTLGPLGLGDFDQAMFNTKFPAFSRSVSASGTPVVK
jgi:hypothetical protein